MLVTSVIALTLHTLTFQFLCNQRLDDVQLSSVVVQQMTDTFTAIIDLWYSIHQPGGVVSTM